MTAHARRDVDSWNHRTGVRDVRRALSSDASLEVLIALGRGPRNVTDLADHLALESSTVSKALGKLTEAGLVCYATEKIRHKYRLSPNVSWSLVGERLVLELRSSDGAAIVYDLPLSVARDLCHELSPQISPVTLVARPAAKCALPPSTEGRTRGGQGG